MKVRLYEKINSEVLKILNMSTINDVIDLLNSDSYYRCGNKIVYLLDDFSCLFDCASDQYIEVDFYNKNGFIGKVVSADIKLYKTKLENILLNKCVIDIDTLMSIATFDKTPVYNANCLQYNNIVTKGVFKLDNVRELELEIMRLLANGEYAYHYENNFQIFTFSIDSQGIRIKGGENKGTSSKPFILPIETPCLEATIFSSSKNGDSLVDLHLVAPILKSKLSTTKFKPKYKIDNDWIDVLLCNIVY